jgi:hypothetical protein
MPTTKEKTALGHVVKKKRVAKPKLWQTARSCKPGSWLCNAMAEPVHAEEFVALLNQWRFHEPVRVATQEEWDAWTAQPVNFGDLFDVEGHLDESGYTKYVEDSRGLSPAAAEDLWEVRNTAAHRALRLN